MDNIEDGEFGPLASDRADGALLGVLAYGGPGLAVWSAQPASRP
ncbi:hypothetical protein [Oricola cellulosilytica]|nr:hypothetical protein [Oricola cellulosilytica]